MLMKILDHLEEWMITFLMAGATLIIFLSVVHRYGTGLPIPGVQDYLLSLHFEWAQELAIIMFVWMAKFGAAYGVRMGVHVGVDVLVSRLPDTWRRRATFIALLCGMLFTGIIGTLGLTFVWENGLHYALFNKLGMNMTDLTEGPTTPDLEWPTWFIYSVVPMGSYLMCFRFIQVLMIFSRTGEMPHQDESHVDGLDDIDDDDMFAVAHPVPVPAHGGAK
jgi:C4-dicarboxylate transporter DctQ subunit